MNVLLVDPPHLYLKATGNTRQINPLGLGYVGASLAREHDVRLLFPDVVAYSGSDPWGEIRRAIEEVGPDVVGISALSANYDTAVRISAMVKEIDPGIVVVLGGVHPTIEPVATLLGAPQVDWAVRGEGEIAALELLRGIELSRAGGAFDPMSVPGLAWRRPDGTVAMSASRPPNQDLDALPNPLRTGLIWQDDVQPAFYQGLITQRGCPYTCAYCAIPMFNSRTVRHRSPASVADEIEGMVRDHGVDYLFFHDPVFSVNKKRTLALCTELVERDLALPHCVQTRVETVSAGLLSRMKEANCHTVFYGIESGSPETLKRMDRRMSLDAVREAVRMTRATGIRVCAFFMIGLPWEDEAMMRQTQDFALSLDLDMLVLSSASPFPGTQLWDMVMKEDLPSSIDFRIPQVNLTKLPDDRYAEVFAEIRKTFDDYHFNRLMAAHRPPVS